MMKNTKAFEFDSLHRNLNPFLTFSNKKDTSYYKKT